jgi:hypothetical protein
MDVGWMVLSGRRVDVHLEAALLQQFHHGENMKPNARLCKMVLGVNPW